MPIPEMHFRALAPGADKPIIQTCSEGRTHQRNHAPRPLLDHLGAGLCRYSLDDARYEFVDNFFFQKIAADVDSGGAGCSHPKFSNLVISIELESVEQAQLLDGAHSDGGK